MGGCVSRSRSDVSTRTLSPSHQVSNASDNVTIGKNKPISSEKPKWKSETPITIGQLRSKRDEYWETQPAFGGRVEIYDALRAACETDDITLAQAIVNGANITLPSGSLTDAYDELGNHYTIPIYCISLPTNIINLDENSSTSGSSKEIITEQASGEEIIIKIRLSTTNKDVKMSVRTGETIGAIKRRIHADFGVAPSKQRCFYSGKLLYDKLTIEETKISKGFVMQVIVSEP
ncbi:ubiquitin domain-containing protein 1 [Hydra vulgaris]|uniref:Ubiquitin domain-containing protein 1 n=1 Tax=Hydra vulgaris TaxID=6087 RepID=T2M5R8_HYDVU|nr:ubiquitin domain-containing protein 1 [Hydra vulgaris]